MANHNRVHNKITIQIQNINYNKIQKENKQKKNHTKDFTNEFTIKNPNQKS